MEKEIDEINAVATLVSKVLPVIMMNVAYFEDTRDIRLSCIGLSEVHLWHMKAWIPSSYYLQIFSGDQGHVAS